MPKQVISTATAPAAVGAYSQGIIAKGFVFTAGQAPLNSGVGLKRVTKVNPRSL